VFLYSSLTHSLTFIIYRTMNYYGRKLKNSLLFIVYRNSRKWEFAQANAIKCIIDQQAS